MNRKEILNKIQDVVRDVLGNANLIISESTCAEEVEGWDSMAQITILEAVQDEFGISLSLEEIIEMKDVEKILNAICLKKGL